MKKGESDDCFVANNAEELHSALKAKASSILITKYYRKNFLDNTELPIKENNLSMRAVAVTNRGGDPFFLLMNRLRKEDKQQRKIDSKVQKYILKEHGEDLYLYLRQLDY